MTDITKTTKKSVVYFQNLDGIRAIAALMVVVSHIEYHKVNFGFVRFGFLNISSLGKVGVTIFFALSGFLITYLLLEEKKNFEKVALKDFYIRRILRIWPLYFLVVLVGFFIYPAQGSSTALWYSVFFIPNLAFCLSMLPAIFDPIWSIGTEEQFYIFHPHLFKIKKRENILIAFFIVCISIVLLGVIIRNINYSNSFLSALSKLLYYARLDNMMIGAIAAVVYYNTKFPTFRFRFQKLFDLIFIKAVQWLILTAFIVFVYFYITYTIPMGELVIAALAAMLIVNLCESQTSILSFDNKNLRYLGKISYGIYLLHKFPLFLTYYLVSRFMPNSGVFWQNVALYLATMVMVIALASLSYYGFERYFLRIKSRFQKVTQGTNTTTSPAKN